MLPKNSWLLLSTLLLLAGCAPKPGLSYKAYLSPELVPQENEWALEAFARWKKEVGPRLEVEIVVGKCEPAPAVICVHPGLRGTHVEPGHAGLVAWTESYHTGYEDVAIYRDVPAEFTPYVEETIEHELGHAFGLPHIQMHTVMYATIGPDQAAHVTSADVAEFWKVRTDFIMK
jgi:hypothetical protein